MFCTTFTRTLEGSIKLVPLTVRRLGNVTAINVTVKSKCYTDVEGMGIDAHPLGDECAEPW